MEQSFKMGTISSGFRDGNAQFISFCVTEDCNLKCKYCYMDGKNVYRKMTLDIAKKAVDFFLKQKPSMDAVVWDFIGGEPTLEITLIDQIVDYIKQQMYLLNHPWFNEYMISIGSNGVLYDTRDVQDFIKKNHSHLSFSITLDGTKRKHDLNRIKKDGSGSYDDIIKNIPLWLEQFPAASTKVTFASADLKYLKESIIHLWDSGLKIIPANIVFEDVWADGDETIYEQQLVDLADYILENNKWEDYSVRFFDPAIGFPLSKQEKERGFCGVGKMVAVDCEGKLYPCIRFLDFCVSGKPALATGNVYEGFNNLKDIFKDVNQAVLNDGECENCSVASGCFSCTGCNYENSITNSIFSRTKFHCDMQKAQIRANEYFWDKLIDKISDVTPREISRKNAFSNGGWRLDGAKNLYFILNDKITPHCMYQSHTESEVKMSKEVFDAGIKFARDRHMIPVFLGDANDYLSEHESRKLHVQLTDINICKAKKMKLMSLYL